MKKYIDYLTAGILMAVAWSLRGQFGHFKGALIPGAAAAVLPTFLSPQTKSWRQTFGLSMVLGTLGFGLGGHLGYGVRIERVLAQDNLLVSMIDWVLLFLTGAVWGGLGSSFLGFSVSEKKINRTDTVFLGILAAYFVLTLWVFPWGRHHLLILTLGLASAHVYNIKFKQSKVISFLGGSGFLGFGSGFFFAVLLIWMGRREFFPGPHWWAFRDQILGFWGGITLAVALKNIQQEFLPAIEQFPETFLARTQKWGLALLLIVIPVLNTSNVFDHLWSRHLSSNLAPAFTFWLILCTYSVYTALAVARLKITDSTFDSLRVPFLAVLWYLSAIAIAKTVVISGFGAWEHAFSIFIAGCLYLAFVLPGKPSS